MLQINHLINLNKTTSFMNYIIFMPFICLLVGCNKQSNDDIGNALILQRCIKSEWKNEKLFKRVMSITTNAYAHDLFLFERKIALIKQNKSTDTNERFISKDGLYISHLTYIHAKERNVRELALMEIIESLNKAQKRNILPILMLQLFSNTLTRRVAAIMCGKLGPSGKPLIPHLVLGLYDKDEEMRRHCAKSISEILNLHFPLDNGIYPNGETIQAAKKWAKDYYGPVPIHPLHHSQNNTKTQNDQKKASAPNKPQDE